MVEDIILSEDMLILDLKLLSENNESNDSSWNVQIFNILAPLTAKWKANKQTTAYLDSVYAKRVEILRSRSSDLDRMIFMIFHYYQDHMIPEGYVLWSRNASLDGNAITVPFSQFGVIADELLNG